ncbi:MAG TPA: hypothetical protein VFD04_00985, partial [Actinomycetes bacterium]|nr:hypothetical protein [Actinomycetes bacterium]
MPRRPELGTAGASVGTRAARAGRRPGGREGQATGRLPLRPRPGLAAGVVDGMLFGVMAWAVLSLTLVPVMAAQAAPLFPTLLLCLCVGGTIGPGLQVGLDRWSPWRRSAVAAPASGRRVVVLGGGFGGV